MSPNSSKTNPTNDQIELIARTVHEANRALCQAFGDFSQPNWDSATGYYRESTYAQIDFLIKNPDAPASALHDSWAEKLRSDGWVHGSEKNVEKKVHPCLVPFEDLPAQQKAKDLLFKSIVDAVLSELYKS